MRPGWCPLISTFLPFIILDGALCECSGYCWVLSIASPAHKCAPKGWCPNTFWSYLRFHNIEECMLRRILFGCHIWSIDSSFSFHRISMANPIWEKENEESLHPMYYSIILRRKDERMPTISISHTLHLQIYLNLPVGCILIITKNKQHSVRYEDTRAESIVNRKWNEMRLLIFPSDSQVVCHSLTHSPQSTRSASVVK